MSSTGPRSPMDDLFDRIEEQDASDEAKRILALDEAGVDRELAAGGFDPAAVRAKGLALGEAAVRAMRHRRLVRGAKIGAVAGGLAAAAILAWWLLRPSPLPIVPEPAKSVAPAPPASPLDLAAVLRADAYEACGRAQWATCARELDEARDLDPAGEETPEVRAARKRVADVTHPDGSFDSKQ